MELKYGASDCTQCLSSYCFSFNNNRWRWTLCRWFLLCSTRQSIQDQTMQRFQHLLPSDRFCSSISSLRSLESFIAFGIAVKIRSWKSIRYWVKKPHIKANAHCPTLFKFCFFSHKLRSQYSSIHSEIKLVMDGTDSLYMNQAPRLRNAAGAKTIIKEDAIYWEL